MTYRRSPRYKQRVTARLHAMREGKARARMARDVAEVWEPPHLRIRLTAEQFDTGVPQVTVFELFRTRRIDTYTITVNGEPRGRMGWSKVLEHLRLAVPRKCSLRWLENY